MIPGRSNPTLFQRATAAATEARIREQERLEAERVERQQKLWQERDANQSTLETVIAYALGLDPTIFCFLAARFAEDSATTFLYGQVLVDGDECLFTFANLSFPLRSLPVPALIISADLVGDPDFDQVVLTSSDFKNLADFGTLLLNHPKRITHEELLELYAQEGAGNP
jgi:hypothetical protein